MWQFAETVRGLADGCLEMGLPVTGGNVSFYNQTGGVAILPTPVIGVLGVIDDVRTRTPMSFDRAGLELYLIGASDENLSGSEWAYLHGMRGGQAPTADLQREMRLIKLLVKGRTEKIFTAAHDLSQGGLTASLTEMVLRHNVGATIILTNPGMNLLVETPGRVVVAVEASKAAALKTAAGDISLTYLGTTGGDALVINDVKISLDELRTAHTSTFQKLFG
jgi:phosphoribosylformylglycinamidine synthase